METSIHSEGIQHKSLVETIVENVEARILRGELKPGERLIEQAMCNQLQVSRSPLREAFRILENRGFLVNKARKGVFVSELSKKDAIDVYTIRANLESLAIYLAVKNDDGTLADRLQEINQKMLFFAEKGDAWNYAKCNQEFHSFLINSCNNQRLIGILEVFNKQTIRYRSEVMLSAGKMQDSIKKHEILIDSIRKKDAEQAEKIRKESILANIEIVSTLFL
ncbi:GntR family transcriptional regulator [Aminiphilus circumscriptus]|uniref:GntR family transcriptional regulator n=1 Tax=Aminiphilus circumscriptus TaxID=290732 RepID=UPI00049261F0|nr:GntR family transcriptional regulator [Aminiphilus circumscriptus]